MAPLFAPTCLAQDQSTPPPPSVQADKLKFLVPAGTRITLVLTHPIQSRHIHRGDKIYAQITFPVTAGSQVVIPPGTFLQGKVEKLAQKRGRGEVLLESARLSFANGYAAPLAGPLTLRSEEGYTIKDPGQRRTISAIVLPLASVRLGTLIGHFAAKPQPKTITNSIPPGCTGLPPACLSSSMTVPGNTFEGTMIGASVGGAVGFIGSLALLSSSHCFYVDAGSPVEIMLEQPLALDRDQVAEVMLRSNDGPVQPVAPRPQLAPPAQVTTGSCPPSCEPGQEWCNGSCVDTISFMNDSNNCGRCGKNHAVTSERYQMP